MEKYRCCTNNIISRCNELCALQCVVTLVITMVIDIKLGKPSIDNGKGVHHDTKAIAYRVPR